LKEEPEVAPEGIATLPPEPVKVPTPPATPHTPPAGASGKLEATEDTPEDIPASASTGAEAPEDGTEAPEDSHEPSAIEVHQYVLPTLAQGTTMMKLRQKIGHEKGKLWTAMLNRMAASIVKHREDGVAPKEMSRRLIEAYSNNLGSLVAAINKIPRTPEGKMVEGWENRFLCSNPRVSGPGASSEAAKDTTKKLEGIIPGARGDDMIDLPGTPLTARQMVDKVILVALQQVLVALQQLQRLILARIVTVQQALNSLR